MVEHKWTMYPHRQKIYARQGCHLEHKGGFNVYGDPSFPLFQRHGGLAVFVKELYDPCVNNLKFTKCTIQFSLSIILYGCLYLSYRLV